MHGQRLETNEFTLPDLHVGQTEDISVGVSPDDIDTFAELSGDYAPLHMDEGFAKEQGFSGRVAHGMLLGALISGFVGHRLPGRYGILQSIDIGFRQPLVPPDTINIKGEITGISDSVGQVAVKVTITDSSGRLLALAKVRSVVRQGMPEA